MGGSCRGGGASYDAAISAFRIGNLLIPVAMLAGDLQLQRRRAATARLLVALARPMPPEELQALLRRALRDPSLRLGLYNGRLARFAYVDGSGSAVDAAPGSGRSRTVLTHDDHPVALIDHDEAALLHPDVLDAVAAGAALHLGALRVGRALTDIDRLERHLHDGVQADLVAALATLRLARDPGRAEGTAAPIPPEQLDLVEAGIRQALNDVRHLAQGARPGLARELGLPAAVRAVAERCPIPVDVQVTADPGWGAAIDDAALALVQESLTNALRHGRAASARILLAQGDDQAIVTVQDDGIGGARLTPGGGLAALSDRISALGGQLVLGGADRVEHCDDAEDADDGWNGGTGENGANGETGGGARGCTTVSARFPLRWPGGGESGRGESAPGEAGRDASAAVRSTDA